MPRFEALSSNGGIIQNAKTPEEHYHNARIHELGGNFSAARKEYMEYLTSNLEALDPWISYETMLKSAEGKAGAAEAMRYFGDKLKPPTVSYQTAMALLDDGDARINKLKALAEQHPDFGPLSWLIIRLVTSVTQQSNSGWAAIFSLTDFKATELFYKLDGKGDFVSTGHLPQKSPQTGLPMVNTYVPLPNLPPGDHTIEVKYTDKNGATNGPFERPQVAHFGSGRNPFTGPRFFNSDMSLFKNFVITERLRGQFRFEAFNVFNKVNLNNPNNCIDCGGGAITSLAPNASMRQLNFGVKFTF